MVAEHARDGQAQVCVFTVCCFILGVSLALVWHSEPTLQMFSFATGAVAALASAAAVASWLQIMRLQRTNPKAVHGSCCLLAARGLAVAPIACYCRWLPLAC